MSAHHSFVVRALLWLLVLEILSNSHRVEATSHAVLSMERVTTSLIEVSSYSPIHIVSSTVLLITSEAAPPSSAVTSTTPSPLIAVVPLDTLEGKLHHLWRNRVIRLSQFCVSVRKMAPLAQNTITVRLEMPAPLSLVLLVDLIFSILAHLIEILLLLKLVGVRQAHIHLAHLLLLHHLHLVGHHTWLHLHLHVMAHHGHIVHLVRCVHLNLIMILF